MIFNIDKETLPREDIEALQLRRLQDLCSRVYANVPFYRKRFDESGIKPGDIKSLADLKNLPFTEKQDLRNYYPFGLFAVPRDNIVRLHASSGTTGIGRRHASPGLPAARLRRHGPVLYALLRPAPVGSRPGSGHRLP